jgi:hypothetical protein
MQAVPQTFPIHRQAHDFGNSTLLDLVQAICEVTADDREVVATVRHLLRSGRVRLCGNFRDTPPETFE